MQKFSRTYRLISVLSGLLLLAGIGMSTGLYSLTVHCNNTEQPVATHHQTDSNTVQLTGQHSHHTDKTDVPADCSVGFSCDCCVDQAQVTTLTKNTNPRTKAELSFSDNGIIFQTKPSADRTTYLHLTTEVDEASPPIFLKNSTFLN